MKTFSNIKRVRIKPTVTSLDSGRDLSAIGGKIAALRRVRRGDDGAWFQLDEDLPEALRSFPKGDPDGRENHILLYPQECDPA